MNDEIILKNDNNSNQNRTFIAFKPSSGITEYQVILDKGADNLWATELQIADIFGRDRTVLINILIIHIKMVN